MANRKLALWQLWLLGIYTLLAIWYLARSVPGIYQTCLLVPGVSENNFASWVQAIFSIVAIAAGVVVVWWQLQEQRNRMIEDEVRRLWIVRRSAFTAAVGAFYFRMALKEGSFNVHKLAELQRLTASLASMSLLEIPDDDVANALSEVVAVAAVFDSNVSTTVSPMSDGRWDRKRATFYVDEAKLLRESLTKLEYCAGKALVRRAQVVQPSTATLNGKVIYYPADLNEDLRTTVRSIHAWT